MCHIAGSVPALPKYTPLPVTRSSKTECAAYNEFTVAYSKSDADVQKALNTHHQTFSDVCAISSRICHFAAVLSYFVASTYYVFPHKLLTDAAVHRMAMLDW